MDSILISVQLILIPAPLLIGMVFAFRKEAILLNFSRGVIYSSLILPIFSILFLKLRSAGFVHGSDFGGLENYVAIFCYFLFLLIGFALLGISHMLTKSSPKTSNIDEIHS